MTLCIRPVPIKTALLFNKLTHRRLPKLQGAMWAIRLMEDSQLVGVGIVGRPTARELDDCEKLQVLRCSVIPGTQNGCSMIYGACAKMARDSGATDLLTYIHEDEVGVSLKASGWIFDEDFKSSGGEWNRPSRPREAAVEPDPKLRYWAPWGEIAKFVQAKQRAKLLHSEMRGTVLTL